MSNFSKDKIKYDIYEVGGRRISEEKAEAILQKGDKDVIIRMCDPLAIRIDTEIFAKTPKEGKRRFHHSVTTCCTLSEMSEKTAIAMVNSGDYTLREALYILANCCERCSNVLEHRYLGAEYGYPDGSEEYRHAGTTCDFCEQECASTESSNSKCGKLKCERWIDEW